MPPSPLASLMRQIEIDLRSPTVPQPSFDADRYFAEGGEVRSLRQAIADLQGPEAQSAIDGRHAESPSLEGMGQGMQLVGEGMVPLGEMAGEYARSRYQEPSKLVGDIQTAGRAIKHAVTEDPFGAAAGLNPVVGAGQAAMSISDIKDAALRAKAEGDDTTYRKLAAMAAAAAVGAIIPGVHGIAGDLAGVERGAVKAASKAVDEITEHPGMIDTRYPTGKKRIDETEGQRKIADLDALKATPEAYEKNVSLLRDYVNMPEHLAEAGTDDVAEHFINHVKDNLVWLHDQVPAETRARSQLWYDGARNITDDWSKKYNVPDTAVAGALAALSPQKDWYQNVSLANRVIDALKGGGDNFYNGFTFSPEMQRTYEGIASLNKEAYVPLFDQIKGKSLGDINKLRIPDDEKAILKAMWVRLYDEAHNSKSYNIVTPEGGLSDVAKTGKGADAKVAWGSMNEIGKAIQAIEGNGDPAMLNEIMGSKHKVRNFYNNILAPNSPRGDVTIDTHAVAAGLLRPLSQKSVEVAHNFKTSTPGGLPGSAGSAASGIQGTYPLYAEAYRRAAAERDILPRQMQSITWEAARGLFPDTFKSANNMAKVDDLWRKYRTGEATIDETRQAVSDLAGGIEPPTWHGRPVAPNEAVQRAPNPSGVSGSGVSGQAPEGTVGRREGGPASGSPVGFASGGRAVVGHTSAAGLPISLEEHKGEIRHRAHSGDSKMAADYGYISNSKPDADGMKVDAYVGPHHDSTRVFVINQQHPHTGKFNEHKVMLGYKDRAHAVRDYTHSFSDGLGHKRVHSIVEMDSHELKDWLKKPHKQPLHMAKGGEVSLASQVEDVAHDLASIAHKNKLNQRQLAYLLKAASGMYLPPDRAMEYANQILTADVNGLLQRFQTYQPSMRTFARLNEMMGGKVNFMGKGHMGDQMRRMKGEEGLQRTQENIQSALESDVVKSKPIMAKALKALNKRI